jgi:hypothetical protein
MSRELDDVHRRTLDRVVDAETTKSCKRTVNAVAIILAAKRSSRHSARPRRAAFATALLSIAVLLVRQHEQALHMLWHLIGV